MKLIKTYEELITIPTFEGRYEYLKLQGKIGEETFGWHRYLNQILYQCERWKETRDKIITRDLGTDLGMLDKMYEIPQSVKIIVHHMNPITLDDVLNEDPGVYDLNNLITTSFTTHNGIHYGKTLSNIYTPVERTPNDMCPWK